MRTESVRASGCYETELKDAMFCDHRTQSIAFSSTEICRIPESDTVALAILAHALVVKSHTPCPLVVQQEIDATISSDWIDFSKEQVHGIVTRFHPSMFPASVGLRNRTLLLLPAKNIMGEGELLAPYFVLIIDFVDWWINCYSTNNFAKLSSSSISLSGLNSYIEGIVRPYYFAEE